MSLNPGTRLALREAQGDLEQGRTVGVDEVTGQIGAGGPAAARAALNQRER